MKFTVGFENTTPKNLRVRFPTIPDDRNPTPFTLGRTSLVVSIKVDVPGSFLCLDFHLSEPTSAFSPSPVHPDPLELTLSSSLPRCVYIIGTARRGRKGSRQHLLIRIDDTGGGRHRTTALEMTKLYPKV